MFHYTDCITVDILLKFIVQECDLQQNPKHWVQMKKMTFAIRLHVNNNIKVYCMSWAYPILLLSLSEALNPKDLGSKSSLLDEIDGKVKKSKSKEKKKDKKPNIAKPPTLAVKK